jgi:hypothetical protein
MQSKSKKPVIEQTYRKPAAELMVPGTKPATPDLKKEADRRIFTED